MITATMVVATVPVTDLERAKEFYGDTLGLTLLWETPVALRYRCGSVSEFSVFKAPPDRHRAHPCRSRWTTSRSQSKI
jgi:catechol 2,3-dioxygenase-like lactoylglutathione lyase family enzyme